MIGQYDKQSFNIRMPLTLFPLQCVSNSANSNDPHTLVGQKFYNRSGSREKHRFGHQATGHRTLFLRWHYAVGHRANGMPISATNPRLQAGASERKVILVTFYSTFIFITVIIIIIIIIIITLMMIVKLPRRRHEGI
jgi:hypothetical protein